MYDHKIITFDQLADERGKWLFKINTEHEAASEIIERLKTESINHLPDVVKLENSCFELIERFPLPMQFLENTFILRARYHDDNKPFEQLKDISYNPKKEKIDLGRFNLKEEQIFYASPSVPMEDMDSYVTAVRECWKGFQDKAIMEKFEYKYFTISKWNVRKRLKAVILAFDDMAESRSHYVKRGNELFYKLLDDHADLSDKDKCLDIYRFFSQLACKRIDKASNYLLTTAFYHALRKYYGNDVAIIYSSSASEQYGINIALTKEMVDDKYIEFERALMLKLEINVNTKKDLCFNDWYREGIADKHGQLIFEIKHHANQ